MTRQKRRRKNRQHFGYTDYAATSQYREQLDKGCFRMVPDNRHVEDSHETWTQFVYLDHRALPFRRSKRRSDYYWA